MCCDTSIIVAETSIRNDFINIKLFRVSKTITFRTSTNWRVKGKESRLDFRYCYSAVRTRVLLVIKLPYAFIHIKDFNKSSAHIACFLYSFAYTCPCLFIILYSVHHNRYVMLKFFLYLRYSFIQVIYLSIDFSLHITYLQCVFQYLSILAFFTSGKRRKNHQLSIFRVREDKVHNLVYRYFSYFSSTLRAIQMTNSSP